MRVRQIIGEFIDKLGLLGACDQRRTDPGHYRSDG
jgi:hypothetical protein